ncbi:MAG TPA: hypothetical protein VE953_06300 [Terriglobales bacterium]|nr:hypothetical protein [Terriglobales bacterium]
MAGPAAAFRWTVALLSMAFILGAYVDAFSRLVVPSPLAPWNDVFMDAAWLAVTGFMAVWFGRALTRGVAWRAALPAGYHLALAGGVVFGLGALADVYYQIAFGFGTGLEALLAPTHLVELAGGGLLVAAPLSQALKDRPERVDWPVVLSAALTLSTLTFLTQYAHPLVDLWASHRWNVQVTPWVAQDLGVVAIQVQVSVLVGVMLLLIRSFRVPLGSLTVLCGINGLCMAIVSRHSEIVWVPLLTGVVADVLLLRVRPMDASPTSLRVFAAAVPSTWAILYWVAIVVAEGGTVWSPQLWVGVVLAAALAGFLVSYLAGIRRPRSVVAAEIWGDRWPQRHVEVSPAAVKEALDVLDDVAALSGSPLARLACISAAGTAAGPELRGLLVDVVRELAAAKAPRDAEAGQLLVDYYVKRVGSHEVIAERLHLSRPTFYRRLQRGLTLTAERLDELAEFAARHR